MYRGGGKGGGGESSSRAFGIDIGMEEDGGEDRDGLEFERLDIFLPSDGLEL